MIAFQMFLLLIACITSALAWTRYEKRVLYCPPDSLSCNLEFPGKWNRTVDCHREKIPEKERTPLNKVAEDRVVCPLGCRPHIIQKDSAKNRNCSSFQTFGKFYDDEMTEWMVWFCKPCQSVFTTNCDFHEQTT